MSSQTTATKLFEVVMIRAFVIAVFKEGVLGLVRIAARVARCLSSFPIAHLRRDRHPFLLQKVPLGKASLVVQTCKQV